MEKNVWEERYLTKETPWDKGAPSPGLVDFLANRADIHRGSVLVPGCGMGHDVRAWAEAGFAATGMDIAPSAVSQARELTQSGLSAEFLAGDYLTQAPIREFDWLFEHTLYCAIQPEQRADYAVAAARWLKPGGMFLAVHYLIPDVDGPPFGTTRDEVLARFSPGFVLLEDWVPRSYENRTDLERMFLWQKK